MVQLQCRKNINSSAVLSANSVCTLWNSSYSDCLSLQSLTEKLHQKELDCVELDGKLRETKRTAQMDKEVLKKATKSAIVYQPLLP